MFLYNTIIIIPVELTHGLVTEFLQVKLLLTINNKLMKGKALRKHSLHEKTAASVLLKLFISSN